MLQFLKLLDNDMDPESLYRQLGQLLADVPEFGLRGTLDRETLTWLGRAGALIEIASTPVEAGNFRIAADNIVGPLRATNAHAVMSILSRAFARAELNAPATAQGAFIPVGSHFDVFRIVGKLFSKATADILLVDPFVDQYVLTQYAALAPENVSIRMLGDERRRECGARLVAGIVEWARQYSTTRPVEARHSSAQSLHDRLVVIDKTEAYTVGQSFKDIAKSSPTSFIKVSLEIVSEKIAAYEALWATAMPLR